MSVDFRLLPSPVVEMSDHVTDRTGDLDGWAWAPLAFDRRRDCANHSRLPVDAAPFLELHGEGATIARRGDLHRLDLDRFTAHPRKPKRRRLALDREQPVI